MLFILKSNEIDYYKRVLKFINEGDKVVLIQDGVLLAHNRNNEFILAVKDKNVEILVLENDLDLRGVKNDIGAEAITYREMVDLIEENKVFS